MSSLPFSRGQLFLSLALLMIFLGGQGCAHPGTPMHPTCRELPTVEECKEAAQTITETCLRTCIEMQCAGIQVNCNSDEIQEMCRTRSSPSEGIVALGYVIRFSDTPTSCELPLKLPCE